MFDCHGITPLHLAIAPAALVLAVSLSFAPKPALTNGAKYTGPRIDCTCRFQGHDYHLGDVVCLSTPKGPRIAQCEMALNNTSWTITDGLCPTASAPFVSPAVVVATGAISD